LLDIFGFGEGCGAQYSSPGFSASIPERERLRLFLSCEDILLVSMVIILA